MAHIGFVTCSSLADYFPSEKTPLLSHDDQVACDALEQRGHVVEPVVWGQDPAALAEMGFDLLVIRSTWDYMQSEATRSRSA